MKIRKIGRERPVLYRGRFDIPSKVISRLAVAKNHLALSRIANFNGKVDQFYLTIDNVLSAVIIAYEGTLTTTNHRLKIDRFFKHLRKRARIRSIDKGDFEEFYDLWQRSRYRLYFPSSSIVQKMSLFVVHLFEFAVTEIARFFKSDKTILAKKIDELLEIYESELIQVELEHIHEYNQMEAEHLGEVYGGKLGMKLANPWNYIDVSLLTDSKAIINIVDNTEKIRETIVNFLKNFDELISETRMKILEQTSLRIAEAKKKKRNISNSAALEEAIEAAAKHPEVWKFRLILNFVFDPSDPKEIASFFSQMMQTLKEMKESPNKAIKDGWENYKEYSKCLKPKI
jgi:transcription termination factor NusB